MGVDPMSEFDERDLIERTEAFISAHADSDDKTLLGAQFDAGLAWVHNAEGEGGLGLEPKLQRIVDQRLHDAGLSRSWLRNPMGIGMVAPTIASHGTVEQKNHLRPTFTGEEIWCQLFSEPSAGSDVATLAMKAVRDGGDWILNGQKVWTTKAKTSSRGLLLARTDPTVPKHDGITCFLVDLKSPGVEIRPIRQMNGAAHFNEVFFNDVRVPDGDRLGAEGAGWRVGVTTLMNERVSIGADNPPRAAGPIAKAVEAYRDAGRPDGSSRDLLAKLWIEAELIRLGGIRAQQNRAKGAAGPEGSILKLAKALLGQRITDYTLDAQGPSGMLIGGWPPENRDDPGYRFMQAQSDTIAGGTTEIMRNILGERVLGLPGESRVDRGAWQDLPKGV
jgi:alkylation response protein AidB-like acyl-CoA dehydrogenase